MSLLACSTGDDEDHRRHQAGHHQAIAPGPKNSIAPRLMPPEQLRIYFDTSPAIRLFQAKHAPLIARFLFGQVKRHRAISRPHSESLPALTAYQEQLVDEGVEKLRDKPDEYLRD